MLRARNAISESIWVFPGDSPEASIRGTSPAHQHEDVREALGLPKNFVIHSFRHTMSTRFGEAGATRKQLKLKHWALSSAVRAADS